MIDDRELDLYLRAVAADLASSATWPDGSVYNTEIDAAVFEPGECPALVMARVYSELSGFDLRGRLAHDGRLKIDANAPVRDAIAGFFDIWARLLVAFAQPFAKPADQPRTIVFTERPKLKVRDTIFERTDGKIGEKTGGVDLSEGQPTSTAQYAPQVPASFAPPPDMEQIMLRQRMAAAGYTMSTEEGDYEDTRARLGGAPPAPPAVKVRVPFPDDGKEKIGTVFIQRPARLAANAPPFLRSNAADAGPEIPLTPVPPGVEE